MDVTTATQMMQEVAKLLQLSATYQARYGRYAPLKPGSPQEAWDIYHGTIHHQSVIARLLDIDAIYTPHYKAGKWWERQDVIDVGTVRMLVQDITHLLACASYHEATPNPMTVSYSVDSAQHTIAGLLQPSSLQIALDESIDLGLFAS